MLWIPIPVGPIYLVRGGYPDYYLQGEVRFATLWQRFNRVDVLRFLASIFAEAGLKLGIVVVVVTVVFGAAFAIGLYY